MDVPRMVRTQISTSELNPPQDLVQGVNNGSVGLLEIVKALGEYLTSTEDEVRLNGLTFLSNTLKTVNSTKINRQATQTLTNFYLSKLDDFDSLPPALGGLTVLSKLATFDDDAAVEVYKGVVENVNMKAYVQATRHLVYVLFDSLLATHRNALKSMGSSFVNSYTKMVDGEKDPRNLMLLFSIDRVILLEFEVKDHIEDFFDITFCYFPITFRPPPNDPYGITADDLKLALRKCMASSPYFARMAIPLFLEKFATLTGPSMKDLQLSIAACLPVYGADAVRERGAELWEGIKTEILYSSDTSIEAAALSALESLIRTLYPTSTDAPSGLAQDIIKECLEILNEPDKTQAVAATKILAAIFRASPSAGKFALSQALPQLFRQFNSPSVPSHRSPILSTISSLLVAVQSVYTSPTSQRKQAEEKALDPYHGGILDVLREGLRTEGLKSPAIKGCTACVQIPGFWEREDVENVVRGLDDVLVNDEDPEIRPEVIESLTTISTHHPTTIESLTLPLLFHNLPDSAPSASDHIAREKYRSILSSLRELCVAPALFQTLVIRITTKLDLLSSSTPQSNGGDEEMGEFDTRECNIAYSWDLLNTLQNVVDKKIKEKHNDLIRYFDQIVPRLFTLVVSASTTKLGDASPLFRDRRLVGIIAKLVESLVWELNVEKQSAWFSAIYQAFEKGDWTGVVHDKSVVLSGSPLRTGASSAEQDLIALYAGTVQGLKGDATLPFGSSAEFLSSKIHWTINVARDGWQVKWILELICAFVNKRENVLKDSLETILESIWSVEIQDTSKDLDNRRRGLSVYLYIIKALSLLRSPLAYSALERVIDILSLSNLDPEFVRFAASGFGILSQGKGNGHLTAKLLFAQKLWNFVLPKLIEGDKEATGTGRLVYLVAFASLLPLVPASLCLADLNTILPLILRSLSLPDPHQRVNAITTLTSILETASDSREVDKAIHAHAEVMVDSLLKSAVRSEGVASSGKVRSIALSCLSLFPDVIRFENLHKHKSIVIRELGKTLDDPLRNVRKEAVECRAKWYRYGNAT
ncbi:hypothetical protein I302_108694 [Kwoniella bestiolae CBS 10118]|uniref:MMS19 nucleotide excision repair protein n=1 Tax=Kwoniella bestiolae CBS 10118 TaxID=1296100 RepID=A0A1B9FTT8_9TREE|nr:DNA repair/transcription protein MET18/MMS19 [Kwoniella bestiolae CBS 10118]OCF22186.1 DNA repair/transcription protein MET18/MMS19 [Kwoniella bestiolae CBS 10118]